MTGEVRKCAFAIYNVMNCSDFFEGAEVVLNDRGATIKIFDDNGGFEE